MDAFPRAHFGVVEAEFLLPVLEAALHPSSREPDADEDRQGIPDRGVGEEVVDLAVEGIAGRQQDHGAFEFAGTLSLWEDGSMKKRRKSTWCGM
jgi:hypothetical protein